MTVTITLSPADFTRLFLLASLGHSILPSEVGPENRRGYDRVYEILVQTLEAQIEEEACSTGS